MKISAISNTFNSLSAQKSNNITGNSSCKKQNVSFKAIYVEDVVDLGETAEKDLPARFLRRDALLLNEIANQYPNQDCFIRKGFERLPRLEYRERPPVVQSFTSTLSGQYNMSIDPDDKDYPSVPLILYNDESPINKMIGLTSYFSLNPSLPYTVKVGFELHKKLLEKKKQIMEAVGKTDGVDLGEETLTQKAHDAIQDIEYAVTRYLLESAYRALTDRASGRQIYESNFPKVQERLDAKRTMDLTTSTAKQPGPPQDIEKIDICEKAMQLYPNTSENKQAIDYLIKYMDQNNIVIK